MKINGHFIGGYALYVHPRRINIVGRGVGENSRVKGRKIVHFNKGAKGRERERESARLRPKS